MSSFFSEASATPYILPVRTKNGYAFVETTNPEWPELEKIFKKYSVKTPLALLPPELHLEILFLHACNHLQAPATIGTVYNLPWAVAANKQVKHDCVVSTPAVVPFLIKKMDSSDIAVLKTIVLISSEVEHPTQLEGISSSVVVKYIRHPLQ